MTETSSSDTPDRNPQPEQAKENSEDLLLSLRRKEGSWVEWGQACATLQKAGYTPQAIFEATGFEPIQQNQVIVGSQVYTSLVNGEASQEARSHYFRKGSDILYELRILTQLERVATAEFILSRNLDADVAREVAKDVKELSRMRTLPQGFSNHPGDAVAYQYWRRAKQQTDLAERSRFIARGLMFAHSQSARQQIEQLLTEVVGTSKRKAPILPVYRQDEDEQQPRIIPVAGVLPLKSADLQNVPLVEPIKPFELVEISGNGSWVSLPGWQVVLKAQEPVVILCDSSYLPNQLSSTSEPILLLIDRAKQEWDADSYFLFEESGELQFRWFPDAPSFPLLGQVILVLRPKKILDEEMSKDQWELED